MREDRDELDQMLDRALTRYVEQEPLAGIEQRVLARVQAQSNERRAGWWVWAAPTAVGGCLLLAFALKTHHTPIPRVAQLATPPPSAGRMTPTNHDFGGSEVLTVAKARQTPARQQHSAPSVLAQEAELPKLDVFPTPVASTEGERQLAALPSVKAGDALAELPQEPNQPMQVAAIHIAPFEWDGDFGRNQQ